MNAVCGSFRLMTIISKNTEQIAGKKFIRFPVAKQIHLQILAEFNLGELSGDYRLGRRRSLTCIRTCVTMHTLLELQPFELDSALVTMETISASVKPL